MAHINELEYQVGSATTRRLSDVGKWVQNVAQPKGSRFTAGYGCRFEAGDRRVSVRVLLAETQGFAERTQWEKLQVVPIRRVASHGREGYAVFKYVREESVLPGALEVASSAPGCHGNSSPLARAS